MSDGTVPGAAGGTVSGSGPGGSARSGGYHVNVGGLNGVAEQLGRTAADIAEARTAYAGSVCYASTAFGEFGVDRAWSSFDTAWSKEIGVTQRALDELSQKMAATTANYRDTEHAVASGLVPAGGGR
ncbi:type VII secretion target [Kitasatospora purpeofusca]|uniref:type VII secretion target n=1 Tax=Kitasatospora purpeofusca TaxID=67352 RepID=UPI002A5B0192|nr:type VII secretion target [Kitasatospora purpeofusca]MDY0810906.1 type VII secretion target [Kitasatospora purpeofusca]